MIDDREMTVRGDQTVRSAWIDIDCCKLGNRARMDMAAIERAFRKLVQLGDCQSWPPVVGHWQAKRFMVCDGRHEYLAALALGRDKLFVCWLAKK